MNNRRKSFTVETAAAAGAPASAEELLGRMVGFETVNPLMGGPAGGEAALAAHLEWLATGWGLRTRRLPVDDGRFNLLVSCEVAGDAEWLLFESHLDTVTVDGMTVEPFAAKVDGERIYGRGTCDTKGSGAAMLWALRDRAAGGERRRNVGVLFAVDEEARMTGARGFAAGALREFLPRLRGVIVGEPTRMQPIVTHNGVVRWRTRTRGVAAHSSDPTKGRSAISAMRRALTDFEENYAPTVNAVNALTGRAAASVNTIRGGTAVNIIAEECAIECDRRTVPGETTEQVLREREAAFAGHAVEHDELYVAPAMDAEQSGALHAWVARAIERHGGDATPRGAPYVTDAGHYAAAGAASLVLGPGDLAQAHRANEWIARDQLALATAVYLELMRQP
ncbi:M20 family metallopeptidase [Horticoccus luteus]|uniref:M20 family metallopeptidase n=1 Tax=Horticoccus luteus TaxID=2862869 RepID=A0A8F9TTV3_9BACT|nr:M20 family metallopeptidase [Horticoccus luteus]QYM77997.1 M20 family metallopeptidase [Horticoccus luteus]